MDSSDSVYALPESGILHARVLRIRERHALARLVTLN
jgi:hypothetical protein